jgi:hypothetical protein
MRVDPSTLLFVELSPKDVDELYAMAARVHAGENIATLESPLMELWLYEAHGVFRSQEELVGEFVTRAFRSVANHYHKSIHTSPPAPASPPTPIKVVEPMTIQQRWPRIGDLVLARRAPSERPSLGHVVGRDMHFTVDIKRDGAPCQLAKIESSLVEVVPPPPCPNPNCEDGKVIEGGCHECHAPIVHSCRACAVLRLDDYGRQLLREFIANGMRGEEMERVLPGKHLVWFSRREQAWRMTKLGDHVARSLGYLRGG